MHWSWAVVVVVVALSLLHANFWVARFMRNALERRELQPLDEADILGLARQDVDIDALMGEVPDHVWDEMDTVIEDGEEDQAQA